MRSLVFALVVVGCAHSSSEHVPVTVLAHALGNGEQERLLLFDSGVMGYQHVGPKLPISRAYGHWTRDTGGLRLDVVGVEPDGATPRIDVTAWTPVADPYGTSPGAFERATNDERGWSYLVASAGRR
jgi:hypothetical protein